MFLFRKIGSQKNYLKVKISTLTRPDCDQFRFINQFMGLYRYMTTISTMTTISCRISDKHRQPGPPHWALRCCRNSILASIQTIYVIDNPQFREEFGFPVVDSASQGRVVESAAPLILCGTASTLLKRTGTRSSCWRWTKNEAKVFHWKQFFKLVQLCCSRLLQYAVSCCIFCCFCYCLSPGSRAALCRPRYPARQFAPESIATHTTSKNTSIVVLPVHWLIQGLSPRSTL